MNKKTTLIYLMVAAINIINGQTSITSTANAITQNFDGMGSVNGTSNVALPFQNWYVCNRTQTQQTAISTVNKSSSTQGVGFNTSFIAGSTDRVLAIRNSNGNPQCMVWKLQNNSSKSISQLNLKFDLAIAKTAASAAIERCKVYYAVTTTTDMPTISSVAGTKDDGTLAPDASWTAIDASPFTFETLATELSFEYATKDVAPKTSKDLTSNITLSDGNYLWIMFFYTESASANGASFCLDNVQLSFTESILSYSGETYFNHNLVSTMVDNKLIFRNTVGSVIISDITGQQVLSSKGQIDDMNIEQLKQGVYVVQIFNKDGNLSDKVKILKR